MLKKISVQQLRPGMYLHSMCGSWLDHPFWKTSFLIRDEDVLRRLHDSPLAEVWIDVSLGADVLQEEAPAPAASAATPSQAAPEKAAPTAPQPRVGLAEEVDRATRVVARARKEVTSLFRQARLGQVVQAGAAETLVKEISDSVLRSPSALISLARLKTRDDYTYLHSVAVCALMVTLARQLGLSEPEVEQAGLAGLLHDLGKAAIPLDILNKPGRLTDAEFGVVKNHPRAGHDLLLQAGVTCGATLDVCLHHHERPDGKGYPERLSGTALTLLARMGAVCDVYDAITSDRPYKSGWHPAESLRKMAVWAKEGQFDETVFKAFVRSVGIYPTGALVRLQSGRLAVVLEQSERSLLAPRVKVFFSTRSNTRIVPGIVDLGTSQTSDRIVGHEDPAYWGIPDLDELWTGIPNRRA